MNDWIRAWLRPPVRTSALIIATIIALLCIAVFAVTSVYGKTLIIEGGESMRVTTFKSTVGDALANLDLTLYPEDRVIPDRDTPITDGMTVKIIHSKPIQLTVDDSTIEARSAAQTVGEAIEELSQRYNLNIRPEDEINIAKSSPLSEGLDIIVERAIPIEVEVDGQRWAAQLAPRTVEQALTKLEIALNPLDKVSLPLDHIIQANDFIKVSRVEEKVETVRTEIPYQTIAKPGDFALGLPDRVVTAGKNGVQEQTVKVVYEDGVEVKRDIISQKIIRPPVSQVVSRGSLTKISRGGKTLEFRRAYQMKATAYCEPGGITATGAKVRVGIVAVDPKVIPLGTQLYVDGYGDAVALDTGGAIKGHKIDLYMNSVQEALNWGVRTVTVYVK